MAFGNVNVDYKPCKSVGQLKSAEKYMLEKKLEQVKSGVVKTAPDLYNALGCERDNFSNNILVTRKLNGKSYSKIKQNEILAHKLSISFHPEDNKRLNYRMVFEIASNFADKFMHEKGHEILFAVHKDTEHIHVHFLVSNCNFNTGKSYRRNKKDLYDMSKYFGELCLEYGLTNSVRDNFYNHNLDKQLDKITFAEKEMSKRGKETFKEELREVIQEEIQNPNNKTFDDVVKSLLKNYNVECRVAGNTISYKHPEYRDKNGNLLSVRGSKLGELYTVKGIKYELNKKSINRENDYPERGIRQALQADFVNQGAGFAGQRKQISDDTVVRNIGENLRNIDSFYERYRKPIKADEQPTIADFEPPKKIRSRDAR